MPLITKTMRYEYVGFYLWVPLALLGLIVIAALFFSVAAK